MSWDCGKEEIEQCSRVIVPAVIISKGVDKLVRELNSQCKNEWLAYCQGGIADNKIIIKSLYFPKQWVTPAHLEVIDELDNFDMTKFLGPLHFHLSHTKPSFSGSDESGIISNWRVIGVVSKSMQYVFRLRLTAQCGALTEVETEAIVEKDHSLTALVKGVMGQFTEIRPPSMIQKLPLPYQYQGYLPGDEDSYWSRLWNKRAGDKLDKLGD